MIYCCLYGLQNCNPRHSLVVPVVFAFWTHPFLFFWPRFWPLHTIPYPTSPEDQVDWNSSRLASCLRRRVVLVDDVSLPYIYLFLYVDADHPLDRDFMTPTPLCHHACFCLNFVLDIDYRVKRVLGVSVSQSSLCLHIVQRNLLLTKGSRCCGFIFLCRFISLFILECWFVFLYSGIVDIRRGHWAYKFIITEDFIFLLC